MIRFLLPTCYLLCVGLVMGQNEMPSKPPLNIATATTGGMQFWTDHAIRDGYRIQHNHWTGHWRLIDGENVRRCWGSRQECQRSLDQHRPWTADDDDGRTVHVLLHGLMRTRRCMTPLRDRLIRSGHPHVVAFGYSSTRREVPAHSAALADVIADWPPSWRLRFVGHSMGNIVVRHWIADQQIDSEADQSGDSANQSILNRCEKMVMLGPPNQGSMIASKLKITGIFGIVAGQGGMQMGPTFAKIQTALATPPFPFAIVAGDVSHWPAANPLLDGPNDLLVKVDETQLDGSAAFHVVPVPHALLMSNSDVIEWTIQWLDQQ